MAIKKRYTAVVEIIETQYDDGLNDKGYRKSSTEILKDSKSELAKFVIRSEGLDGLKTKITRHVEIV